MGYSDIGCFESEISTPNLDSHKAQEPEWMYHEWAGRRGVPPRPVINPNWNPITRGRSIHTSG